MRTLVLIASLLVPAAAGAQSSCAPVVLDKACQTTRTLADGRVIEQQCNVDVTIQDIDDSCPPHFVGLTCGRCVEAPGLPPSCGRCRMVPQVQ
jgi:hypothetical protein